MLKSLNNILSNTVIMVVIIILCLSYIYVVINPIFSIKDSISSYERQLEYLQAENSNLQQTYNMISDDDTRQKKARELYQLSEPDEILFKFPDIKNNNE